MTDEGPLSLVRVDPDDLSDVEAVFDDLAAYSRRVDGVPRREGAARAFAVAVPPGHDPRAKHAFLARRGERAVGLLDIVDGYPAPGTAFVGLLAIREAAQGAGLGRALYREAERFAEAVLGARRLRLAVVTGNPVLGFWARMGFRPTGEVGSYEGAAVRSEAVILEKTLRPAPPRPAA